MSHLIYDVAVSIDGYISGPDGDISAFPHSGQIVDDYVHRLDSYAVALMGRATYEFGYAFGLQPGANPYPQMRSTILSRRIDLPPDPDVVIVRDESVDYVRHLKAETDGNIYLCGGGSLAASLAEAGLIDRLFLKRAPILLGGGTRLFGERGANLRLTQTGQTDYGGGLMLQSFDCERA